MNVLCLSFKHFLFLTKKLQKVQFKIKLYFQLYLKLFSMISTESQVYL